MKADVRTTHDLFQAPGRYEIPIYQRPYSWEDQWALLWDDVVEVAESHLEDSLTHDAGHFLGAIVLQQRQTAPGDLPRWIVIDGQQRLLTMQVLLDASEYAIRNHPAETAYYADALHDLIENKRRPHPEVDPDTRFKLWPTSGDRDAFRDAMSDTSGMIATVADARILRAHYYFREQVAAWLGTDLEVAPTRAEALQVSLGHRLKFVSIVLDANDNPNVIFETLNARGTPLLAWDLSKNFLLHQCELRKLNPQLLYEKHLKPLEDDPWWRHDARRGSAHVPRIDLFLYHWLILRTGATVDADNVFGAFVKHTEDRDMREVAADLARAAEFYRDVEQCRGDALWQEFIGKWRILQAGVTTPYLMWLREAEEEEQLSEADKRRCLVALESFFVRRAVCRIASRGLNRHFAGLVGQMQGHVDSPADALIAYLENSPTGALEWPSDESFSRHLRTGRMYRNLTRGRTRLILEGLERALAQRNSAVIKTGQSLFIEHLLPQTYLPHYPLAKESLSDDETPLQQRGRLLHTLGNLSLTTAKMGIAMSNSYWRRKRAQLRKSGLSLNVDVLNHSEKEWNDVEVVKRGKRLADLALEIWPPPEKI